MVTAVSPESPVEAPGGKLRVLAIADQPDPFDPAGGDVAQLTLVASVDEVAGLGGASPNHAFKLAAEYTVRDLASDVPVRTVVAEQSVTR